MKLFAKGDRVYFVKPGCLDGAQVPIERVVFDREEDGLAYVTDSAGSTSSGLNALISLGFWVH